eukprot:scaffold117410_cov36-Prasinocladus_malaysianus.AAC.1
MHSQRCVALRPSGADSDPMVFVFVFCGGGLTGGREGRPCHDEGGRGRRALVRRVLQPMCHPPPAPTGRQVLAVNQQ